MTDAPTQLTAWPAKLQWLDRPPLALATGLRGHVTVLLLWRLGCVHSRLALAELASLQQQFAGRACAVVAVHTPVEAAEHDTARLQRTVAALAVPVTVAVDAEGALRRTFAATALPLLVLADVDGAVAFCGRGEPIRMRLHDAIESLLQRAERRGTAARVPFVALRAVPPTLWMPTALAADGELLWVAAAGHRRIYAIDAQGRVQRSIGSGRVGADDGAAEVASFHSPNGLVVHGAHLLVADAGTHTLRAIERATGVVATWCGNGRRSTDRHGGGFGPQQGLCAPAGLAVHESGIYLALAGAHQLWQFDPDTQAAAAWSGSGVRSLRDGEEPTFAEPMAIAVVEQAMLIADAGNGALRHLDLGHNFVRTVAQGLARPTAVVVRGEAVFVAASCASAVQRWQESAGLVDWMGAAAGLREPVALASVGAQLWIADVGADCLFYGDPDQLDAALQRVDLAGAPALPPLPEDAPGALLAVPLQVPEFSDVTLRVELPCAADEQLDGGAPIEVDLVDEATPVLACDRQAMATADAGAAVLLAPFGDRGHGALRVRVSATVRRGPTAAPHPRRWHYVVPVEVGAGGELEQTVRAADQP